MTTSILKKSIWALPLLLLLACEKEENGPKIDANNLKGMFVVCEGSFNSSNGDITYFHPDSLSSVKDLYQNVNDTKLGDILTSFEVVDTLGFLVVNNSQKVTVVNMKTFKKIKDITGFSYPRNIVRADDDHVYISNGNGYSDNYVYSINLNTLAKADSVEVGKGPEKMVKSGNKIYVANSGGFTSSGTTVSVIDIVNFEVVQTHNVGNMPNDLVVDKNKNVWAYCKGVPNYDNWPNVIYAGAALCKINTTTDEVTSFAFGNITTQGINSLAINPEGTTLYYVTDATYKMAITATALPTAKFNETAFYGIDVDPESGYVVGLDEITYTGIIFTPSGAEVDNFSTGSYPNGVVFHW